MVHKLLAQVNYHLDPIISPPPGTPTSQIEKILSMVIGLLTVFGVLYFTFQIIFAGYSFMTTEGDQGKIKETRKKITESILGLAVIIIAVGLTALIATLFGLDNVFDLEKMFTNMGL